MINNLRISFMPISRYNTMEVKDVCQSLASIGYDAVEWTSVHFCHEKKTMSELKEVIRTTREFGMDISEIVVQKDMVVLDNEQREKNIVYVEESIRKYSSLGIKTVNLFTGPLPWIDDKITVGKQISEGHAWELVFDAYDRLVKLAEKYKMNLAVENVWGMLCYDFYTTQFLINHYKSDYLGVNYDPSHDILAGNYDVGWIVKQWGDYIKHIHLKDAAGIQTEGKFVFPLLGEGFVNWKDFFQALIEIEYDGYLSVEFESFEYLRNILNHDIEEAAKISYRDIHRLLQL